MRQVLKYFRCQLFPASNARLATIAGTPGISSHNCYSVKGAQVVNVAQDSLPAEQNYTRGWEFPSRSTALRKAPDIASQSCALIPATPPSHQPQLIVGFALASPWLAPPLPLGWITVQNYRCGKIPIRFTPTLGAFKGANVRAAFFVGSASDCSREKTVSYDGFFSLPFLIVH